MPYSGNYKVELWGASGYQSSGGYGRGLGAYVAGNILLSKSSSLYAFIGQTGGSTASLAFNGGGKKGIETADGSGGGATDIRTISSSWNNANSLRSRIIVAAGGAGSDDCSSHSPAGGSAGGLSAYFNSAANPSYTGGGTFTPASQTAGGICKNQYGKDYGGGSFGMANQSGDDNSAGGGGGWYGGANCDFHGFGGTSYISGHTGAVAVTSTSSSSPKSGCTTGTTNNACSITPYINPATNAGYTFTSTVMIDGAGYKWTNAKGSLQQMPNPSGGYYASGVGHSGNGYARITYLGN